MGRGVLAWLGVVFCASCVCARVVAARTTGCEAILAARAGGLSVAQVQAALATTAGKVATCDQVSVILDRVAAHQERAAAYRQMLEQRSQH